MIPVFSSEDSIMRMFGADKESLNNFFNLAKTRIKNCDENYIEHVERYINLANEQYQSGTLNENEYNKALRRLIDWNFNYIKKKPNIANKKISGEIQKILDEKNLSNDDINQILEEERKELIEKYACIIPTYVGVLEIYSKMGKISEDEFNNRISELLDCLLNDMDKKVKEVEHEDEITFSMCDKLLVICTMFNRVLTACFNKGYLSKKDYNKRVSDTNDIINHI